MLFLIFQIGNERYALDAAQVAVVLPPAPCKQVPEAPPWVRGIFSHEGSNVPVLDVSMLALGTPAAARLSTRMVLVRYTPEGKTPQLLGLIVERATDTLRCEAADFTGSGLAHDNARYLGPVMRHGDGLIQWIKVADMLDAEVQALLFPEESPA
ncbi:chemotaxis protein CheW [Herbaspirillum lusitanum]|uniref:chemotaxis protein CheW n=1 Tax=Herbaspirillum lusitanum TaxID=213312 RepID=UPI002237D53E|nr:chemotaxis protein CheW [Herbaspirillum lusitanum]MCW5299595.1 chemotaxis protein CheW [Herbaspirillum lusitanum]